MLCVCQLTHIYNVVNAIITHMRSAREKAKQHVDATAMMATQWVIVRTLDEYDLVNYNDWWILRAAPHQNHIHTHTKPRARVASPTTRAHTASSKEAAF